MHTENMYTWRHMHTENVHTETSQMAGHTKMRPPFQPGWQGCGWFSFLYKNVLPLLFSKYFSEEYKVRGRQTTWTQKLHFQWKRPVPAGWCDKGHPSPKPVIWTWERPLLQETNQNWDTCVFCLGIVTAALFIIARKARHWRQGLGRRWRSSGQSRSPWTRRKGAGIKVPRGRGGTRSCAPKVHRHEDGTVNENGGCVLSEPTGIFFFFPVFPKFFAIYWTSQN